MATELKRFMVSVTPELEIALDRLKQQFFYNKTQSEMIRVLLGLGIEALQAQSKTEVQHETDK